MNKEQLTRYLTMQCQQEQILQKFIMKKEKQ